MLPEPACGIHTFGSQTLPLSITAVNHHEGIQRQLLAIIARQNKGGILYLYYYFYYDNVEHFVIQFCELYL